jgi:hypothetical protein
VDKDTQKYYIPSPYSTRVQFVNFMSTPKVDSQKLDLDLSILRIRTLQFISEEKISQLIFGII